MEVHMLFNWEVLQLKINIKDAKSEIRVWNNLNTQNSNFWLKFEIDLPELYEFYVIHLSSRIQGFQDVGSVSNQDRSIPHDEQQNF